MSISIIGSSKNFSPEYELSKTQIRSAEHRAITDEFKKSLPGSGENNPNQTEIRHLASDFERISQTFNKKLKFVVDQQSNEVIVKVIDKFTDKVIKILPPEELQRLHRKLKETIGFLFNEMV